VWAIAVVWQDRARLRLLAVPLFLLAWSAHYLPCLWALALLGYVAAARSLGPRRIWWLLAGGVAALCALAAWIAYRVPSRWIAGTRIDSMFGVDQVMPFGSKYAAVAMGLLCLWIYLLVRRFEEKPRLPDEPVLQLWILGAAACLVLPDSIWIPLYTGGLRFITIRLSMMSAVLFCAVLAPVRLRIAETLIATGLLALFLALSFSDERALNTVEQQVAQAAATLPTGARVVATLKNPKLYIQALTHIADRPCIGRCFDVGNYEATTGQFRLRARPGNTYLIGDHDAMGDLEADRFVFRRSDFDLYQFSACADGNSICVSRVRPGERLVKRNIALSAW
jgi:hypothetical protein